MRKYAIIVAGGAGTRMNSDIPKQFLLLRGKPILQHTIELFEQTPSKPDIIVVLPHTQFEYWAALCLAHNCTVAHTLVQGGATRSKSVYNALKSIHNSNSTDLVAIHDGVRPLVNLQIIEQTYKSVSQNTGAIAAIALKDSLRRIAGVEPLGAVGRADYCLVQTPQTFRLQEITQAYTHLQALGEITDTDDASVFERAGNTIVVIESDNRNIKITSPEDLKIANCLLD
jgi:2-C-methyl-D-erythritol 4-phosphate cytidylyltransferase